MKRLLPVFGLLLAILASVPALAAAVVLRPAAVIDGDVITLGDLWDHLGAKARTVITHAPQPGRRVVLDADWLGAVAAAHGVDWRPLSRMERIIVERRSTVVGADEIVAELRQALSARGVPDNTEIQLVGRDVEMHLPVGGGVALAVRTIDYDERTGRFAATVEAATGGSPVQTRVEGRVYAVTEIPVLTHGMQKGEVVGEADVEWKALRQNQVQRGVLTEREAVVGQQLRHAVRAGQPLRAHDVRRPVLVSKGSLVTMALRSGGMQLSALGRAVEDGGAGDTIRVTNTHSKVTVQAKVEATGVVSVMPTGRILAN